MLWIRPSIWNCNPNMEVLVGKCFERILRVLLFEIKVVNKLHNLFRLTNICLPCSPPSYEDVLWSFFETRHTSGLCPCRLQFARQLRLLLRQLSCPSPHRCQSQCLCQEKACQRKILHIIHSYALIIHSASSYQANKLLVMFYSHWSRYRNPEWKNIHLFVLVALNWAVCLFVFRGKCWTREETWGKECCSETQRTNYGWWSQVLEKNIKVCL